MPDRLLILGTGLIGTSVGLAAKRTDAWLVTGFDATSDTAFAAKKRGGLDAVADDLPTAAGEADLIVLAVPPARAAEVLSEVGETVGERAVVTDALSVKRAVTEAASIMLPDAGRFVGAHPMAGSERSGPDAARADLFDDAPCLLTPTEATDDDAAATAEAFWTSLGCRVTRTWPSHHDRMVAQVSHLPHVLAAALARLPEDVALRFAGAGFRDTTRIAAGDATLWADILQGNADEVMLALRECVDDLRRFAGHLERGAAGRTELIQWLADAADRRAPDDA